MRNQSKQSAYGRARRHSLAVSVLKRVLPLAAVGVVGGFTVAATMSGAFEAERAPQVATATQGEVVMANPRMDGVDRNDRPYALKADAARQATSQPAVVALDGIDAQLPTDDGTFASIDATEGVYDTQSERLTLSNGVQVRDLKGLDMDLSQASFDMAAGTMVSEKPVEVRSRNADIDADSMKVLESGKRILFNRRVRMVIHNRTDDAEPKDKSSLLGPDASSTAPWIHTSKLSVAKFVAPAADRANSAVVRIEATN